MLPFSAYLLHMLEYIRKLVQRSVDCQAVSLFFATPLIGTHLETHSHNQNVPAQVHRAVSQEALGKGTRSSSHPSQYGHPTTRPNLRSVEIWLSRLRNKMGTATPATKKMHGLHVNWQKQMKRKLACVQASGNQWRCGVCDESKTFTDGWGS